MQESGRSVSNKSGTTPVTSLNAHDSVLHGTPRSKILRRGLVLIGVVPLYLLAAGLTPAASRPGQHSNVKHDSATQVTTKEELMSGSNETDQSAVNSSHHVSVNVSQRTTSGSTTTLDSSSSSAGNASTSTDVVVNGQHISVPQNGSVHKTIPGPNGNADVDINVDNTGSGTSSSSSSMDVNISSDSQSSSDSGGP